MPWINLTDDELELARDVLQQAPQSDAIVALEQKLGEFQEPPAPEAAGYLAAAQDLYADDEHEFDVDAVVNIGDDGAFVMGWFYVSNQDL